MFLLWINFDLLYCYDISLENFTESFFYIFSGSQIFAASAEGQSNAVPEPERTFLKLSWARAPSIARHQHGPRNMGTALEKLKSDVCRDSFGQL